MQRSDGQEEIQDLCKRGSLSLGLFLGGSAMANYEFRMRGMQCTETAAALLVECNFGWAQGFEPQLFSGELPLTELSLSC